MWWVPLQTRKSRCGEADRLAQSLKAIHVGAGLETRPRGTDTHAIDYFSVPLLEMSFTCHNNRALKVHNSVAVGALTKLHHHHHCLVPEHSYHPRGEPWTREQPLPILPSLQPLAIPVNFLPLGFTCSGPLAPMPSCIWGALPPSLSVVFHQRECVG